MSCGVGRRLGSDPVLLWLWRRPAATASIRPLPWEPPYAEGAAQEIAKRQKKKKKKKKERERERERRFQINDLSFQIYKPEKNIPKANRMKEIIDQY